MKEVKFTKEQSRLLGQCLPVTRKWLVTQFQKGRKLSKSLRDKVNFFNVIERNIYQKWHRDCLAEMKKTKLHLSAGELFNIISRPEVSVRKALSISQKWYTKSENEKIQKYIGKIISRIKSLADREKSFYKEASEALENDEIHNVLEDIADRLANVGALDSEDLLYTEQSIKHVNRKRALGKQPSVHEIYQALEPRFAANNDLYQKQIKIVCDTYKKGEDVPEDVKSVCFEFIELSIEYAGYIPAPLIEYIFGNDTISEEAFNLFVKSEKIIKDQGMQSLISSKAKKLATKMELNEKNAADLTQSELNILRLIKMFEL